MFKTVQSLKQGYQLVYDWIFPQHKKMVVFIMFASFILGVVFLLFSFNTYAKKTDLLHTSSDEKIDNISSADWEPKTVETQKFESKQDEPTNTNIVISIKVGGSCKEDDKNKFAQFKLYLDTEQIGASTVNCNTKKTLSVNTEKSLLPGDHTLTLSFDAKHSYVNGYVDHRTYNVYQDYGNTGLWK
jgi:acyl-CoA synthetase (AMP-forming)/AMP-acid ligase II